VPQIIPAKDFKRLQKLLHSRRPNMTPPRISNSVVLLTGLARCDSCGSPMMLCTGKGTGGYYRYCACSANRLKGASTCKRPVAVREDELNALVLGALAGRLLTPERLPGLIRDTLRHRHKSASQTRTRKLALEKQLKETNAKIGRLITAVADGSFPEMKQVRDQIDEMTRQRDESARLLLALDSETPQLRQALSKQQATSIASTLKHILMDASPTLQKRYVHGLVTEILVNSETATIAGPPLAIAAAVATPDKLGEVRSFVREWRTGQDSNPRPPDS
jgi:site-specific DNA recombinase